MQHFTLRSSDGRTTLLAVMWQPQGKPVAILQIAHGMIEYIERYDAFAQFLCAQGFLVVGHDHLGHGASIRHVSNWGHFGDQNGFDRVVDDLNVMRKHMRLKYPDTPYFILGHSMGSFALRSYLCTHAQGLSGAIIMGTGHIPALKLALEKIGTAAFPQGDVACIFPVFDGFNAVFQFWEGDEDFPPAVRFLWPENSQDFLKYETLYYVMGCFMEKLKNRIEEIEKNS